MALKHQLKQKNMVLTEKQKLEIIAYKHQNMTNVDISYKVRCAESSIRRFWKKFLETKSLLRRSGSGRPRKTTERDDRDIVKVVMRDRFKTAPEIGAELKNSLNLEISTSTVQRRMRENDLFARRPAKKPLLTPKMRSYRLNWCKERKNWVYDDWAEVIFSDESKINLISSDTGCMVRRKKNERFRQNCVQNTVKHSPYVMVWGAITSCGVGEILLLDGYVNSAAYIEIVKNGVLPSIDRLSEHVPKVIFQDDSAPCHRSKLVSIQCFVLFFFDKFTFLFS